MKLHKKKTKRILEQIDKIIETAKEYEKRYSKELCEVQPVFKNSAANLVHYMALRQYDIREMQDDLGDMGLSRLDNIEAHVMRSLLTTKTILNHLNDKPVKEKKKGTISVKKSRKFLNNNTKSLFGYKSRKRNTRIMVTLPSEAASDYKFINKLISVGMNSARINCAHDNTDIWKGMIDNIYEAKTRLRKNCKVVMDLGGPKLRTGQIKEGPKVVHIKPERDDSGNILSPAMIWLAPPEFPPQDGGNHPYIPVNDEWLRKARNGDIIKFTDAREKNCSFEIVRKQGKGKWAKSTDSSYINTGTKFYLNKQNQSLKQVVRVGELLPLEQSILLKKGDRIILHKDPKPGEPAEYDPNGALIKTAHISCTLPEVFPDVEVGEPILFDDGKIVGRIEEVSNNELLVHIINAKDTGSKLKADKGINLPESNLIISGLTIKDKEDLKFVAVNADVVNLSFVNNKDDVNELIDELRKMNSRAGVILKIETQKGFNNLPSILLAAMKIHPIGVMIARGDLAIETGWKNIATIQEEILRICEAAHIPDVWATQVLENLAKKVYPREQRSLMLLCRNGQSVLC